MSINKNITMREYNGTDYDVLYPKTLTSQTLGNWDLDKVSGVLGVTNGGTGVNSIDMLKQVLDLGSYTKVQFGRYTGTGTYGSSNPNSITFDFPPDAFKIFYSGGSLDYNVSNMIPVGILPTSWPVNQNVYLNAYQAYMKISNDGKTVSWYTYMNGAEYQLNMSGHEYYWIAISATGGSETPSIGKQYLLTGTSGTFTVPATGKYYLELHGGGGGGIYNTSITTGAQGGLSCSIYSSVNLTKGDTISYVCGTGASNTDHSGTTTKSASNGGTTTFGTYSASGGGGAKYSNGYVGGVAGGTNGVAGGVTSYSASTASYTGVVTGYGHNWKVTSYGIGGYAHASGGVYNGTSATNGCVLLEYLGT